ncbi:hypothetical protein V495_07805 [Pseudogymnoascus sp. VKM F-4514 (FW-929)]|nr:hypothetical protein V490_08992 [Pseudogymnoascus sp. VKM F-3557]KFY36541.1 hypothetical protein V495_07805 [Pseudogymnoascus sp. VKM F-4514 (FW-929)]KFY57502.1 hypothetical protein V497_05506 [Pseudogymnoascus sp. VKM F-4516 (FW-969)]
MASYSQANGHSRSDDTVYAATTVPNNIHPKWDAAALLDPKASHNSHQVPIRNEGGKPKPPPTSGLVFEFDSPQPQQGFAQYSNSSMANGNGFGAANGHAHAHNTGHMLERIHNVSDRAFIPQKRRRLDTDNKNHAATPTTFLGGGQGGVVGEYLKEEREARSDSPRKAPAAAPAVDLTVDDEVTILGTSDDKEVCYGRIEGADINAFKVPTAKEGTRALSRDFWPHVKVILRRKVGDKTSIVHVVDSTRSVFGCLDVNTAIGLVPLLDSSLGIRTSARILARQKKQGDLPPGADCSCRFNLDLTLYGAKKHANQIGRHLSQKQLWLRTPLSVEAGIELCNPHASLKQNLVPRPGGRCVGYVPASAASMRTVEEIRSDVLGMFDSLQQSENIPEMTQNALVTTELLPHQKQGLRFMTNKEKEFVYGSSDEANSSLWQQVQGSSGQRIFRNVITCQEQRDVPAQVQGGILADMMGLGKTLSILSLLTSSLDQAAAWAQKTPPPPGEDEVPLKKNTRATLLVSPLSTIANWEEQIGQHIKQGGLKYHIYHGGTRCRDIERLANYDLIITTYGSVASECNRRIKGKPGPYPLEELNWFRIVLDEAHMIREQATLQSKAICRLQAQCRWAVTGTPVQNRLDDLGALLKFLRLKPFDEKRAFAQYILAPCKNADPEILPKLRLLVDSITLRRLKDRINLPPRHDRIIRLTFSREEQELYNIFSKNASDRVKVLTSQQEKSLGGKAYVHILQSILRLRLICAHGRELLGDEDLKITAGITKDSAIELDDDNDADKPALSPKQAYEMYNLMRETNADACSMCNAKIGRATSSETEGEGKDDMIGHMTPCYHLICNGCIKEYKKALESTSPDKRHSDCYICKQHIRMDYFALKAGQVEEDETARAEIKEGPKHTKALGRYSGPHTKTIALLQDLLASKAESDLMVGQPPIKSVVFSGWTSHLDLIQMALEHNDIKYTRLDGKMSRTARGAALETFRLDPTITVILVSINAGGLGLNLTTANKVYVMEPQYNPAAEAQAVDRVHRLGQKREVETVRYIMSNSFEEKMLELQDKKKKLASLSMDRDHMKNSTNKAEATKKRLEDLRSLFK